MDFGDFQKSSEVRRLRKQISAELIRHVGYFIQMSRLGENQEVPPIMCNFEDPRAQLSMVLRTPVGNEKPGSAEKKLNEFLRNGGILFTIKTHFFPNWQSWWFEMWRYDVSPVFQREFTLTGVEPLYPLKGAEKEIGKVVQWLYLVDPVGVVRGTFEPYPTMQGWVMWFNLPGQREVRKYWEPDQKIYENPSVKEQVENILRGVHYRFWGKVL